MPTYDEVLSLAKRLSLEDQARLRDALSTQVAQQSAQSRLPVEVDGSDEIIPADEIAESDAALQDYYTGRDPGLSATALKQKIFGGQGA